MAGVRLGRLTEEKLERNTDTANGGVAIELLHNSGLGYNCGERNSQMQGDHVHF